MEVIPIFEISDHSPLLEKLVASATNLNRKAIVHDA
jgi:hypothetical protein